MLIEATIQLAKITCTKDGCGIVFAIPEQFRDERQRDHAIFYCPNGHARYFPTKSKEEILQDELTRERARLDQAKAEISSQRKSLIASKGQITKIKNRIANGVCPCCNRHFSNLHEHMKQKHPNYQEAKCKHS